MRTFTAIQPRVATSIPEAKTAKFLFTSPVMAWFWLIVRLYVGYQWLTAGFEKLTARSIEFGSFGKVVAKEAWVFNNSNGAELKGFIMGAIAKAHGAHPAVQDWFAWFLQHAILPNVGWFSYVIVFGEIAVGLGLIVGALTGIAAFFGLFMNLNFLLAGTVSINPILAVLSLLLILAWRIAGYYGVDRYLLPALGTPWTGSLIGKQPEVAPARK